MLLLFLCHSIMSRYVNYDEFVCRVLKNISKTIIAIVAKQG